MDSTVGDEQCPGKRRAACCVGERCGHRVMMLPHLLFFLPASCSTKEPPQPRLCSLQSCMFIKVRKHNASPQRGLWSHGEWPGLLGHMRSHMSPGGCAMAAMVSSSISLLHVGRETPSVILFSPHALFLSATSG